MRKRFVYNIYDRNENVWVKFTSFDALRRHAHTYQRNRSRFCPYVKNMTDVKTVLKDHNVSVYTTLETVS